MYYRVKRFSRSYTNMYVLDSDNSLPQLRSRTTIDCAGQGPKTFIDPSFVEAQEVKCTNLGGLKRDSDIIKDNSI
ncbi:MAG: hypothetical protein J0G98_09420 [Terrimonas ferruginea]|uniref:hypothetical protein n=1 Tax=Terrimonas ferruginea TaxID=249 RepID=UPI0009259F08|nr:hypothetical protein [Terrimonas ferruginea]MBN8783274.1 hypothetical protein [Terrimonas ferruginea]OJW39888.1 MAG: hypothetical protein BGO56_03230 [Sphingobacteriales bacterium 48-107]